jgi:hypothetical protein
MVEQMVGDENARDARNCERLNASRRKRRELRGPDLLLRRD